MIEAGRGTNERGLYYLGTPEHLSAKWNPVLLRPHGRSGGGAGDAGNIHYVPFDEGTKWYLRNGNEYFITRAQAAQAANKNFIDSWNRMVRNPEL